MSWIGISISIVTLINLSLGFLVFLKNRKDPVNQSFLNIILTAALWAFGILVFTESKEFLRSLIGLRVAFVGASLIPVSLLIFSLIFPKKLKSVSQKKYFIVLLPPVFFALISLFSPFIVKTLTFEIWGFNAVYGSLYLFFAGYFFFYLLLVLINLIKQFLNSSGIEKLQFKYVFLGLLGTIIIGTTTNLVIPAAAGLSKFSKLGPISVIFFSSFTAYAIIRKKLFGVRVILTQLLVGLITILLLINLISSETSIEYSWKSILFVTFLIFGYLLIKSVLNEIRQREKMEKMAGELRIAYEELKRINRAKSEFISMASHQLRTPLTSIKGYISMLLEGDYGDIGKKQKEILGNVFQSNQRLIKIVNELLNISRIELGKMELTKTETQIEDLVESCCKELAPEAEKKKLKMIFKKPKTALPKLKIDNLKIRQVIINLIDNAIRYTSRGEIEVNLKKEANSIVVSVRDTGEGLSEKEKKEIFEGFTRGSAGTAFFVEGAGLGLYVAKKYIELHQGRIWVESQGKGKGSTFYVKLPIK